MNGNLKPSNYSTWKHKSWMIQQTHPCATKQSNYLFHAEDDWKTHQPQNPFNTILRYNLHETQFRWKGISGCQGLAVRLWCLSETYPILFSTGRAELMFHFRKHPLPLDPQPDVWYHPGLSMQCDDVCCMTKPGPESSAKLNLERQRKAKDTSTVLI